MIPRTATSILKESAQGFPVVSLTGPRQSGKSTLVRQAFPDYTYVPLETPSQYALASADPEGFLRRYPRHAIFDEVQRVPHLFDAIQASVDNLNEPGQYILTGSQNFLLLKEISQSLAGRVGILYLPPLTYEELASAGRKPESSDEWVWKGGYPRLFDAPIRPPIFFSSYLQTYVDRDVRAEIGTGGLRKFNHFVALCASRCGEILNMAALARDCEISPLTASRWISVLESSFIVFELRPYYRNFGKQLIKAPKLYFYDTGLAAYLLGLGSADDVQISRERGSLFENAVIAEIAKRYLSRGQQPPISYWRDNHQKEIDLIIERGPAIRSLVEIKSSTTFNSRFFANISSLGDVMRVPVDRRFVVYGGSENIQTSQGQLVSLDHLGTVMED